MVLGEVVVDGLPAHVLHGLGGVGAVRDVVHAPRGAAGLRRGEPRVVGEAVRPGPGEGPGLPGVVGRGGRDDDLGARGEELRRRGLEVGREGLDDFCLAAAEEEG